MVKCEYCGEEYEPAKPFQRYCSDKCRKRAHRERKHAERKKAIKSYQDKRPQQNIVCKGGISEQDPRSKLAKLKAKGLMTLEYWTLFAEVDMRFNGGRGVVNGIPTTDSKFAESVLLQITDDGIVHSWTQTEKQKKNYTVRETVT